MNYNTTPLPRIINSRDPITGKKLVIFHTRQKRYKPNRNIPVCRSGEEHLVENYDSAKKDNFKDWVCHHRLELTLDGEFANSSIDLVNKDMYFHRPYFELIWIRRGEHARLHNSGSKAPMYGKGYLRTGDKNPMYSRTGDRCPNWKGDNATDRAKYLRQYRAKKRALRACALPPRSNSN